MSDPNTEPAQSTADIVRDVVEQSEAPAETPTTESAHGNAIPSVDAPAPSPELSPALKFLLSKGHKAVKEDGKKNWLPVQTVAGMLDDYVGTHRSTWDSSLSTIQQERDKLKADLDELYAGVRHPDTKEFLKLVAKHDPRYNVYLEPPKPQAPALPSPEQDQEPGPDLDLGDGRLTYSLEGLKKRDAWRERQILRMMDERLKPFAERERLEKERAERESWERGQAQRVQAQIADAQTWPGFKENSDEILKTLQADTEAAQKAGQRPQMSLEAAYRHVVIPKLTADATKAREEALKQVDEQAKLAPPTVTRPGGGTPKAKQKDNRTIVAEIVAASER